MTKLDRYLFRQLVGPFTFFCFITSSILLLNHTLGIIDIVTENGQPAYIVFELSFLMLPKVLISAIPISGFIASILTINRLFNEEELLVMMSVGRSYLDLSKPILLFGIFIAIIHFLIVHNLAPYSHKKFLLAEKRIKDEYITQIIKPEQFISLQNKYTFFFGSKGKNGDLNEILIEEKITTNDTLTHIAKDGQVVKDENSYSLLLKNGSTQSYNKQSKSFNHLHFDTLVFDLNQLKNENISSKRSLAGLNSIKLKNKINTMKSRGLKYARAISLFHDRIVKSFLTLLFPLLAVLGILVGGYNRFGYTSRIIKCILGVATLDLLRGACKSWVMDNPSIWLVQYLSPFLTSLTIIIILLLLSTRTNGLIKTGIKVL